MTPAIPPTQRITELWALVVTDENGGQGVPCTAIGTMVAPLITSQLRMVPGFIGMAKELVAEKRIASFQLLHFTNPKEIPHTEFE